MASRYWIVSLPVHNSAFDLWKRLSESVSKCVRHFHLLRAEADANLGPIQSIRLCKGEGESWGNAVRAEEVMGREIKRSGTLHEGPSFINGKSAVQPMQAGPIIAELEEVVEKDMKTPKHPSPRSHADAELEGGDPIEIFN